MWLVPLLAGTGARELLTAPVVTVLGEGVEERVVELNPAVALIAVVQSEHDESCAPCVLVFGEAGDVSVGRIRDPAQAGGTSHAHSPQMTVAPVRPPRA